MIQFNLLPDIKLEYIKAKRQKRLVFTIALLVGVGAVILLFVSFSIKSFQQKHLNDLNSDIKKYQTKIATVQDLSKVLTIQNQLNTLPTLYAQRPVTSRVFDYLKQTTPTKVNVSHLTIDFAAKTMIVQGAADSIKTVNQFVDTYKFTTYTVANGQTTKNAFSNVVMTSFSRDEKSASFNISLVFDTDIFDQSKDVKLIVPQIVSTRSSTEKPTDLFNTETPR